MNLGGRADRRSAFVVWGLTVTVCLVLAFSCVGTRPPGINESHYLPKAKYAWDSSYASGGDLFLQSANSHWLSSLVVGVAARSLDLSTVAWLGRIASWLFWSIAWVRFCRALELPAILQPLSFLAWFLLHHYGHWSGEWVVGGFEAKAIAYPCVLLALANIVKERWNGAWIWFGIAIAWHPIVGGWALLTAIVVWLAESERLARLRSQRMAIAAGLVISLVGILPALAGLAGDDRDGNLSAAQIHAFYRLAHHMAPRAFALERHWIAILVLILFALITFVYSRKTASARREPGINRLIGIAWSAVAVCVVGLGIEQAVNFGLRPDIAARFLRFYFFRWADVVVPLAIVVVLAKGLTLTCFDRNGNNRLSDVTKSGSIILTLAIIALSTLGLIHWRTLQRFEVPPADARLMNAVGPFAVDWGDLATIDSHGGQHGDASDGDAHSLNRYQDWLSVCQWIRDNTPEDSFWFTPRHQQTFKWHAGRAEVVNWKDVPQDNASVLEWYKRIQRCEIPKDASGKPRGWTTDELVELARLYGFNWILIDRTYQDAPPLLEMKYPIEIDNRSFAVFYIPDVLIGSSSRRF